MPHAAIPSSIAAAASLVTVFNIAKDAFLSPAAVVASIPKKPRLPFLADCVLSPFPLLVREAEGGGVPVTAVAAGLFSPPPPTRLPVPAATTSSFVLAGKAADEEEPNQELIFPNI